MLISSSQDPVRSISPTKSCRASVSISSTSATIALSALSACSMISSGVTSSVFLLPHAVSENAARTAAQVITAIFRTSYFLILSPPRYLSNLFPFLTQLKRHEAVPKNALFIYYLIIVRMQVSDMNLRVIIPHCYHKGGSYDQNCFQKSY